MFYEFCLRPQIVTLQQNRTYNSYFSAWSSCQADPADCCPVAAVSVVAQLHLVLLVASGHWRTPLPGVLSMVGGVMWAYHVVEPPIEWNIHTQHAVLALKLKLCELLSLAIKYILLYHIIMFCCGVL